MNKRKTLLQRFTAFNAANKLASAKKRTLLTVSGGLDSAAMCSLFHQAQFPFAIAHCNFQLRGDESDGDEKLVVELGKKYGVKVFTKRFDTAKYAEQKKVSIQVAARELRYAWFEELRAANKFDCIATAHHLNDNIETIILNLTKGTGIRGLRGIPMKQGKIIRPLLFASRTELEEYVKENKLEYREDSSNSSDKYTRNKIRQQVIPLLKEINPALETAFAEKIALFTQLENTYERETAKANKHLFLPRGNDIYIPIQYLKKLPNASSVLFEFLKNHEFNAAHVEDMLDNLNSTPGKQFITEKARIIKDRRFFILTPLPEKDFTAKLINEQDKEVTLDTSKLSIAIQPAETTKITAAKNIAYLDASKIKFPLIVRRWKAGDYFYPFGLKLKKKKLKKFFTDEKVPLHEKEKAWVIESDNKIVWVAGYRIDERFKVSEKTKQILKMELQK